MLLGNTAQGPYVENFSEMLLRIVLSFDLSVKKFLLKSRTFLRVGDFYKDAKSSFQ